MVDKTLTMVEWLIKTKRINQTEVCPNCGETYVSETFMRFDCLNPHCKFFQEYLAEQWQGMLKVNPPYFDSILIDVHPDGQPVWKDADYLDLYVNPSDVVWDLWSAKWWGGEMIVVCHERNRISVEIKDKDNWLSRGNDVTYPQVVEAFKRFEYLKEFDKMGIK